MRFRLIYYSFLCITLSLLTYCVTWVAQPIMDKMLCSLIGYLYFSHWRRNNIKQKKCRRITLEWPYRKGEEAMLPSYWIYSFELYVNVFHSSVCEDIYACVFLCMYSMCACVLYEKRVVLLNYNSTKHNMYDSTRA